MLGLACSTGKLNDADDFGGYSSVAVGVDCSIVAAMDVTVVESAVAADTVEVDRDELLGGAAWFTNCLLLHHFVHDAVPSSSFV